MTEKAKSFCFYGKWFDDEQGFWDYVREWPSLPVDIEEIRQMLSTVMYEINDQNETREGKMTNREAFNMLRLAMDGIRYEEDE